jgi:TonB-linked SusC/RagA family outer membrane protein
MKKWRLSFSVVASAFMVLCMAGAFTAALAQEMFVSGSVVDSKSGKAISGVSIKVKGVVAGGFSDAKGQFRVRIPNANAATLVFNYIGYKPFEYKATQTTSDVSVKLEEDVLKTSDVVVTGIASGIKKTNSPNSIGTISAKDLVPAPAQTVDQAFAGKFAGISITQNTGAPGGGINVNLRGVTTLTGSSQPLYVIDGMIINNNAFGNNSNSITAAGANQDQNANRVADINPNDIEDIQVLKGPSAAAIYGAKAAAGVIVITTKKGTAGRYTVDVTQQVGFNQILKKVGQRRFNNEQEVADVFGAAYVSTWQEAVKNGLTYIDHEQELYGQNGFITETTLGLRGGSEQTQIYVGGTFRNEDGIIRRTGYQRSSVRTNITHNFSDNLTLDAGLSYIRTRSSRSFTGNGNVNLITIPYAWSLMPSFDDVRRRPDGTYPILKANPANPYEIIDKMDNIELINRYMASGKLNWKIFKTDEQKLEFVAIGGADFFSQQNDQNSPINTQHEAPRPTPGIVNVTNVSNLNANLFLNLIYEIQLGASTMLRATLGTQFENQEANSINSLSQGFVTSLTSLNQAQTNVITQNKVLRYDQGYFGQIEADINDRIYLSAGFRADRSSANGNVNQYYFFPKASASARLSQFEFWEGLRQAMPEFKLRVAYGEAGNPAPINAKFTTLVGSNIAGLGAGLGLPGTIGNPDILPERASELEAGIDATFADGLVGLEATYFIKTVFNLIANESLPRSSGVSARTNNIGTLQNTGIEIALNLNPIRTELVDWRPRINFFASRGIMTELKIQPFNSGGFGSFYGTNRVEKGYSPTMFAGRQSFGPRFPGDTQFTASQFNGIVAGDALPDFQVGFASDLRVGNFNFYFLIDWRQGQEVVNLTQATLDEIANAKDVEAAAERQRIQNLPLGESRSMNIEDGSFVKVREVALNYTFDKAIIGGIFGDAVQYLRLGLSGRNLFMFTRYLGYDPEVSNFGNVVLGRGQDVAPFPSSRSFYFNVALGF